MMWDEIKDTKCYMLSYLVDFINLMKSTISRFADAQSIYMFKVSCIVIINKPLDYNFIALVINALTIVCVEEPTNHTSFVST